MTFLRFVDQTILASDPKRQGNCLPACVATYLGRPLDEVPHFVEMHTEEVHWWGLFMGYMYGHGLQAVALESPNDGNPGELIFVMGMSARGVCHQVLYRDGTLAHDPHPSRDGVLDIREVLAFRPIRHDHAPTPEGAE